MPFAAIDEAIRAMARGDGAAGDAWYAGAVVFAPAWRSSPARACPRCVGPMRFGTLLDVPIDRCDAHGYWFDAGKLERVLFAAAPQRPPDELGVRGVVGGVLGAFGYVLEIIGIFL